ncbi:DUF6879 family protein [Pseudonocardia sp. NPDC046786]|uniref:DUF6879 family protein n=1 Tax=Pseudonocardia sp. NPDC046786 TaxID=3155471 RepID=UPI0033DE4F43
MPDRRSRRSAFRLETRQSYAVDAEDASPAAFRAGTARPERSVRTSPWLARIATDTVSGKDWSRVRLVERPLTEYTRWELLSYVESQAAGGGSCSPRPARSGGGGGGGDFWLFDADTAEPSGFRTHYDAGGRVAVREPVDDPDELRMLRRIRDRAVAAAVPLNEFLAGEDEVTRPRGRREPDP